MRNVDLLLCLPCYSEYDQIIDQAKNGLLQHICSRPFDTVFVFSYFTALVLTSSASSAMKASNVTVP